MVIVQKLVHELKSQFDNFFKQKICVCVYNQEFIVDNKKKNTSIIDISQEREMIFSVPRRRILKSRC